MAGNPSDIDLFETAFSSSKYNRIFHDPDSEAPVEFTYVCDFFEFIQTNWEMNENIELIRDFFLLDYIDLQKKYNCTSPVPFECLEQLLKYTWQDYFSKLDSDEPVNFNNLRQALTIISLGNNEDSAKSNVKNGLCLSILFIDKESYTSAFESLSITTLLSDFGLSSGDLIDRASRSKPGGIQLMLLALENLTAFIKAKFEKQEKMNFQSRFIVKGSFIQELVLLREYITARLELIV